jgi:hypothetical protein
VTFGSQRPRQKVANKFFFIIWARARKTSASARDHGRGRIGNRVRIPDGCAAVMDDEGPIRATIPQGDGKAGLEGDSEVRRPGRVCSSKSRVVL